MPLFRKSGGPHDLAVSMSGVKMGDRLLQIGCGDGGLLAALGAKVGLTGRACGLDENRGAADRARTAAARAGVLVEIDVAPFGMLPFDDDSFDLVVANGLLGAMRPEDRARCLQEAQRALRPGGRCVVIDHAPRGGLGRLLSSRQLDEHYVASGGAETALKAEGYRAVRQLAEREGLQFVEGVKPR